MPINYQNGYIYKLWSLQTEEIYIGSSTTDKRLRLSAHKSQYKRFLQGKQKINYTSFEIVKYPDCKIEIIEKYPCNSRAELCKREGEIQRATECCNRNIAGRTHEEWREANKEYHKEWYQKNKDKGIKRMKEYNKEFLEEKKKKIKIELDELYNVLTGEDDIPILEAISELQSLLD